jgi:hypothetical protein
MIPPSPLRLLLANSYRRVGENQSFAAMTQLQLETPIDCRSQFTSIYSSKNYLPVGEKPRISFEIC